jgi:two-component system nitrogen regulation sensor histidine kinase NtrY
MQKQSQQQPQKHPQAQPQPQSYGFLFLKNFFQKAFRQKFSFFLSITALLLGLLTFSSLGSIAPFEMDTKTLLLILGSDIVVLLLLSIVIAKKLVELWLKRKKGLAKARLHVRLTVLFGALAVTPAIIMTLFSVIFFHVGIQDWFSTRVKTALDESVQVAQSYLEEHKRLVGRDASLMAHDLRGHLSRLLNHREEFNQYLTVMGGLRSMTEALVFDESHNVLGKSELTFALEFEPVPFSAVNQAAEGTPVVLTSLHHDRVRALVKVSGSPERYLFVGRAVDANVLNHLRKAENTVSEYKTLEGKLVGFEVIFIVLFSLVALLLLLVAIWIGLVVSGQIIRPIAQLMEAADRISQGDFTVRLQEGRQEDEMALLSRAFNRMTSQLESNQTALLEINQTLEERRRFIESTLAGVSSGVLGLNDQGVVNFMNDAAKKLLPKMTEHYGNLVADFFPEIEPLITLAASKTEHLHVQEIRVQHLGQAPQTFLVHIVGHRQDNNLQGYVITLDDLTTILAAQKQVAWSDVARRIAHEIKNPLTPIQLSAERLKRKYMDTVEDPQAFKNYIDMISKQVTYIQDMIGEFVAFSRMPSPIMKRIDLGRLCQEALVFHVANHAQIKSIQHLPELPVYQYCDEGQIMQCLANILKNAVQALEESSVKDPTLILTLKNEKGETVIEIMDNGPGFPFATHRDVTEPYVTTRQEGTGLGLSIVKKIMEDHNGRLEVDNVNESGNGRVRLVFS